MFSNPFKKNTKELQELLTNSITQAFNKSIENQKNLIALQNSISELTEERRKLKDELADLTKKKELEEIETEHLIALKDQRIEVKLKEKELELSQKFMNQEMELRKKGFDEMVGFIKKQGEDIKDLYKEIMSRLPNVNMKITEKRGQ